MASDTITVKDANDNDVAIEKPISPARKAAADSRPVVLSSEDLAKIQELIDLMQETVDALNVDSSTFLEGLLGANSEGVPTNPATASGLRGAWRDIQMGQRYTYTDASISSATGASQTLLAAADARRRILIHNCSTTSWWINPSGGTAAAFTNGSFELVPGASWTPGGVVNAITGIGVSASKLTVVSG